MLYKTKGGKVEVIFQKLWLTCDIHVLVYYFKFHIFRTHFTIVC
jgi:hypothetical protein